MPVSLCRNDASSEFSFWHLASDIFFHKFSPLNLNTVVRLWLHSRWAFLSRFFIVHFCPNLVDAAHFWLKHQRAPYFSSNFENFTIVRFWWNLRCVFLSQFSIVHFYPELVVAPHIPFRGQRALYLSPNFETLYHCLMLMKFAVRVSFKITYCIIQFKILEFFISTLNLSWLRQILISSHIVRTLVHHSTYLYISDVIESCIYHLWW